MAGRRTKTVCKFYIEGRCTYGDNCKFFHPPPKNDGPPRPPRNDGTVDNVCKFFLEGKCNYGVRCRFIHPQGGRQHHSYDSYDQSNRYQPDAGQGWNQRGQGGRKLYSSHDETDQVRGWNDSSGHDRGRRGQHEDHTQKEKWRNQGNDRYHYSSPDYRQSHDHQSHPQSHDHQSHPDYRQSHDHQSQDWGGRQAGPGRRQDHQNTVFRDERRGLFNQDADKTQSHDQLTDQPTDPGSIAALIRKDMEEAKCMLWIFSGYWCSKGIPTLPGLVEISPEELRLEDYTARASGLYPAFLQSLEEVRKKQVNHILLYANITSEEVEKLLHVPSQIALPSDGSGRLFGSASTTESDAIIASVFNTRTSAPLMSGSSTLDTTAGLLFAQPSQSDHSPSSGPSLADQVSKIPSPSQETSVPSPSQDINSHKLTEEELEAFKAERFILKKIPEHPPPPYLC